MTTLIEGQHTGEGLLSEASGTRSRENVVVTGGNYKAGQVLGKISLGEATAAAKADNTGNGTIGTVTVGAGAKVGDYIVTFIEPASGLGNFIVEDPEGITVGSGVVATAFTGGGIGFTIADGTPDFVAGDQFTITVEAGSGEYTAHDPTATDGSAIAAAILYAATDASTEDQVAVALVRDCEWDANSLIWKSGISGPAKAAGIAALARAGIVLR